jgi:hypothetical protein
MARHEVMCHVKPAVGVCEGLVAPRHAKPTRIGRASFGCHDQKKVSQESPGGSTFISRGLLCLPKRSSRPTSHRINTIRVDLLWWGSPPKQGHCYRVESRGARAENKAVTDRTFMSFRGPAGPKRHG